ncbi:hypothetical protein QUB61_36445 [Microcoleus sp. C2D2]
MTAAYALRIQHSRLQLPAFDRLWGNYLRLSVFICLTSAVDYQSKIHQRNGLKPRPFRTALQKD